MKYLVFTSDDFGMCHAVNMGIVRAFREGVLTQASIMPACPWFGEAAAQALEYGIPVGVHLTATCDWDRYRWRPLTHVTSFVDDDGAFMTDYYRVREVADRGELEAEFRAQIELCLARGLQVTNLDVHMAYIDLEVMARLCREYLIPTRVPQMMAVAPDCCIHFDSPTAYFSEVEDRKNLLHAYMAGLTDGYHIVVGHLAELSPELGAMASQDWHSWPWTSPYRVKDQALFCDPDVRDWCDEFGIQRISLADYHLSGITPE